MAHGLESLDESAVERMPGVVKIWRSGDFVGVCCEREYQAVKALEAIRAGARWIESEVSAGARIWRELLPTLRSIDSENEAGERAAAKRRRAARVGDVFAAADCACFDGAVVRGRAFMMTAA